MIRDHWHLLFHDALFNHHRFRYLQGRNQHEYQSVMEFPTFAQLRRYQKTFRVATTIGIVAGFLISIAIVIWPVIFDPNKSKAGEVSLMTAASSGEALLLESPPLYAPRITSIFPNSGPDTGGTIVTVQGDNFTQAPVVSIGGTLAENVVFLNSTTISITTSPKVAGVYDLVVTNPDGRGVTLSGAYTYLGVSDGHQYMNTSGQENAAVSEDPADLSVASVGTDNKSLVPAANPAPTISSLSPARGTKLGGNTVTITGTNFYGLPTITFGGNAATNVVLVNATTVTALTPVHAVGVVDVIIVNPDGQSAILGAGFTFSEPLSPVRMQGSIRSKVNLRVK